MKHKLEWYKNNN